MSKAVLISIQPLHCKNICTVINLDKDKNLIFKKRYEVRKNRPSIDTPFKCYIYMSKGQRELLDVFHKGDVIWGDIYHEDEKPRFVKGGYKYKDSIQKVIGEFVCDKIIHWIEDDAPPVPLEETALTYKQVRKYSPSGDLYLWHISDLVIYDKPKELSEFCTVDESAVRNCICREQVGQPKHITNNGGWIKGGFLCFDTESLCTKCKRKPIVRPPQSWCYVEEVTK